MRSVSYVQRVALEFSGSLFPHAICLGDVDNDTLNELVVGDTSGKVSVYKNDDSRPWLTCSCQGMLTCVGVGDVCNKGKNLLVAVSAEGWFHLFDLTPAKVLDASGHHETLMGEEQRPVFKQHIPANTKVMLISDIGGHAYLSGSQESRSQWVLEQTPRDWGERQNPYSFMHWLCTELP